MKENIHSKESFFDETEDILCVLDAQGNFRQVNSAMERVLGHNQHDLLLKPITDFVHEDDREKIKQEIEKLQNGLPITFEILFRTKAGSHRLLSWSMTPREDTIFAIAHDITRARSDLDKLNTAQNRLRLLHQATSDPAQTPWQKVERVLSLGNMELKAETAILSKLKAGTRIVVRSVSEEKAPKEGSETDISKTFNDIVLKAGKTIAIHNAEVSVYSEHPAHTEFGIKAYIGTPLILQGDIYGVLSFESGKKRKEEYDITDFDFIYSLGQWISSTLSLLKANEHVAYNAAIVGSSDDAIIGQSIDGIIESVNAGAEKLMGYSEEELIGKKYTMLFPKELKESIDTIRERLLKGERVDHHHTIYSKKNGKTVDVSLSLSPIVDEERNFVGFSSIARDITKERQIDKAKTEFVSLASHQLRTPLSAIIWYAELLLKGSAGKLKEKQKDFVSEIFRGARRILVLVNDLLNVSRIELGTFSIRPEKVEVIKTIRSILKEASKLIISKNIDVEEKYQKDFPIVLADPSLLRMVIQNIIMNSLEYTPNRGIVSVSLTFDKENYSIEVKDTGYGIPVEDQEHIFEKLYRGKNIVKHDTDGTGLGLYIAKSIVEISGGTITFESEENVGTTFVVTLPIKGVSPVEGEKEII
ncbi:PAS domain S-box protein [Patescibacteria group bacterium]|nr:PAS domain S-box protein [Patescibacteria group bacterium]